MSKQEQYPYINMDPVASSQKRPREEEASADSNSFPVLWHNTQVDYSKGEQEPEITRLGVESLFAELEKAQSVSQPPAQASRAEQGRQPRKFWEYEQHLLQCEGDTFRLTAAGQTTLEFLKRSNGSDIEPIPTNLRGVVDGLPDPAQRAHQALGDWQPQNQLLGYSAAMPSSMPNSTRRNRVETALLDNWVDMSRDADLLLRTPLLLVATPHLGDQETRSLGPSRLHPFGPLYFSNIINVYFLTYAQASRHRFLTDYSKLSDREDTVHFIVNPSGQLLTYSGSGNGMIQFQDTSRVQAFNNRNMDKLRQRMEQSQMMFQQACARISIQVLRRQQDRSTGAAEAAAAAILRNPSAAVRGFWHGSRLLARNMLSNLVYRVKNLAQGQPHSSGRAGSGRPRQKKVATYAHRRRQ